MLRYFYICCIAILLTGCGQKGPLYLPEKTSDTSH
ncbi:MAG: lipoprotein [Gammaproteobacteria bacterium]